ncbi:MFS general substrate transporter [Lipomyces japonicus]|uniref:MFS general substrate transporter n=1 Tax=Lipomyces japonicus TaxID=56871 RepID=UPI0034CD5A3A
MVSATKPKIDETAIPGTVFLVDLDGSHNQKKQNDLVLIPAPSDDPEDPLNWSTWRKWKTMGLSHFYTFVVGWSSAAVYSILLNLSDATGLTVAQLNSGTGTMLLFFGWGCLIWQPMGLTFGRRGMYLLSLAFTAAVSVWTAYSTSYATWVVQRILLGLVGAPIECQPEITVTDLYFNHQRGRQIGIYLLALSGGAYLAPLCNGFINQGQSWEWVMYWCAILSAIAFVVCFFFMEETMYYRETTYEAAVDPSSYDIETPDAGSEKLGNTEITGAAVAEPELEQVQEQVQSQSFTKPTYLQSLALWRIIPDKPNEFFKIMYRPFLIAYKLPIVLWAGCYQGVAVCAFSSMNATASVILSTPPYGFKSSIVGLFYIAPTIGTAAGALWAGEVSDRLCIWLAKRNGGWREAEFRLWSATLLCVIPPAGMILWGVGAVHGVHWFGLAVGMAMLGFTLSAAGSVVIGYTIDCYKELAGESMMSINILRCTIAFGYGYAVTPWLDRAGYQNGFIEMACICIALFSSFLVFIKYGKQFRKRSTPVYWKLVETGIRSLQAGH